MTSVALLKDGSAVAEVRPLGFFPDELSAVVAVADNDACLVDDLVVIEEVSPGLLQPINSVQWFKRDAATDIYFPIDTPPQIVDVKLPLWRIAYEICAKPEGA